MTDLGPRYAKAGFGTPPETVQLRLQSASAAAAGLTATEFVPVVRVALGLPVDESELSSFRAFFAADPTFGAEIGSPELRLLAAAILVVAMDEWQAPSYRLPIITAAALLGGLRAPGVYDGFVDAVERELTLVQQVGDKTFTAIAKSPAFAAAKAMAPAVAKAGANDVAGMATELATVITALANHSFAQDEKVRTEVNNIGQKLDRLGEQMGMQWWVTNGYSEEAGRSFSKIPGTEAVIRCSKELAALTTRGSGVVAAPALLDQMLEKSKAKKKFTLAAIATGSPIEWRDTWVKGTLSLPNASLCPTLYAIRLATEARDQNDWRGRYEREISVSPDLELDALDWANQLYREHLANRYLGSPNE